MISIFLIISLFFEQFRCIVPYPKEVFISSQKIWFGVWLNISIHICLPHPGGQGLGGAKAQWRGVIVLLFFFRFLLIVIWKIILLHYIAIYCANISILLHFHCYLFLQLLQFDCKYYHCISIIDKIWYVYVPGGRITLNGSSFSKGSLKPISFLA